MDGLLDSVFDAAAAGSFALGDYLLASGVSLALGLLVALVSMYKSPSSKGFGATLTLLPLVVQTVIMLVNGNLGAGVAVAGAFSLVRFRSAQGSAREICAIFLAMAVGLATGMGYLGVAALLALIASAASVAMTLARLGERGGGEKELRLTVPESLDYSDAFDEVFASYADAVELTEVKTTNLGSLFRLRYRVKLKKGADEKAFIDALRCRNGNLEIVLGLAAQKGEL